MGTAVTDILELSVSERLQIVEDIWDSIAVEADDLPLSEEFRSELDRRLDAFEENPDEGVRWDELKGRLQRSGRNII